jgi:hypothetical protein
VDFVERPTLMKPIDDLAAALKLVQSQASARYEFPEEPGINNI